MTGNKVHALRSAAEPAAKPEAQLVDKIRALAVKLQGASLVVRHAAQLEADLEVVALLGGQKKATPPVDLVAPLAVQLLAKPAKQLAAQRGNP